jgi:hypothetical protein
MQQIKLAYQKNEDIAILMADPAARFAIPRSKRIRVFSNTDHKGFRQADDIFVITTGLELPRVAEFVKATSQHKKLRGLLIRQESNQNWLPLLLKKAGLRNFKNLLVYSDYEVMRRVLSAWGMYYGRDNLIADGS